MTLRAWMAAFVAAAIGLTCGQHVPDTHYYQLRRPSSSALVAGSPGPSAGVIRVEDLVVDGVLDDDRIVYRTAPVQLDFYNYHRWSMRPGQLIADYLSLAYGASGLFCRVVRDDAQDASLVVGGRVLAFEEVDVTTERWVGRVDVLLQIAEPKTGRTLWQQRLVETEPLERRHPAGLASALSRAMARIAQRTEPLISEFVRGRDEPTQMACSRPARKTDPVQSRTFPK